MNDNLTLIIFWLLTIIAICVAIIVTGSGWWLVVILFFEFKFKLGNGEKENNDD
jgi:hypothetical protein